MKAMILAAGLGTRLRPLTDDRPKALVEIAGRTLLEITLRRLRGFGISEVIVNVHHHAGKVVEYLSERGNFGMQIEISREDELLDTGGGLMKAAEFFLRAAGAGGYGPTDGPPAAGAGGYGPTDGPPAAGAGGYGPTDGPPAAGAGGRDEAFVLHNVDVISSIDLAKMVKLHCARGALATLGVQRRESSRYLLFDGAGRLCGRRGAGKDAAEMADVGQQTEALAFSGIHVISTRIFNLMEKALKTNFPTNQTGRSEAGMGAEQAFSIIPMYLRLAREGEEILGYRADKDYWRDVGTEASLRQAAKDIERKIFVP